MTSIAELQSGKGHKDENFPVASFLIAPQYRPAILAFYRFVRAADDVADHPGVDPEVKLALLEQMRASLEGEIQVKDPQALPEALALRQILLKHGLSPVHALDLLEAFRRDCTKLRYRDWEDLLDYCRYSAMPVGRFVLEVHGEDKSLWSYNDALCAALQIINHLQDCAKDYLNLNRVYLPQDSLATAGIDVESLGSTQGSAGLLRVIAALARRNSELLDHARPFAGGICDGRLALEVDLVQTLAEDLNRMLMNRDPLSQSVHHSKLEVAKLFVKRMPYFAMVRLRRPKTIPL